MNSRGVEDITSSQIPVAKSGHNMFCSSPPLTSARPRPKLTRQRNLAVKHKRVKDKAISAEPKITRLDQCPQVCNFERTASTSIFPPKSRDRSFQEMHNDFDPRNFNVGILVDTGISQETSEKHQPVFGIYGNINCQGEDVKPMSTNVKPKMAIARRSRQMGIYLEYGGSKFFNGDV